MNNYIALGILPKPVVKRPAAGDERARQLGYFPADAVVRVETVQRLKGEGLSMSEIVARMGIAEEPEASDEAGKAAIVETAKPAKVTAKVTAKVAEKVVALTPQPRPGKDLRLSLGELGESAYMVDYNFFVEWCNDTAAATLFGLAEGLDPELEARSLFKLALSSPITRDWTDRDALLRFHLSIAKNRLPKRALASIGGDVSRADLGRLDTLYDEAVPVSPTGVAETRLNVAPPNAPPKWMKVYASFFREGILFIHQSTDEPVAGLLELLGRRDQLIRHVVTHRRPVLTPVCVMVADLQDSVKICAELPPEEYFELINEIWQASESVLRKYHATQGKHAGDGMVSYFFPQPDSNYLFNALSCANELKQAMRRLSAAWRLRKNWVNDLLLNIGLNEGEEWFGTLQTATNVEFTVLGDTVNHAGRLSDFARYGAVWVTKNLIGKLSSEEREPVRYGIRRVAEDGRELWVPATYSRLSNLIDLSKEKYEKFRDISALAIAEVSEIVDPARDGEPKN